MRAVNYEMATDEQSFSLSLWRPELFMDSDGRLWGLKAPLDVL
ncbi:hypothetical protein LEMLEM_LOCUS26300 [Lemmus lemmus]